LFFKKANRNKKGKSKALCKKLYEDASIKSKNVREKKLDKEKVKYESNSNSNSNENVDCFKTINEVQEKKNVCSCSKLANNMIEGKKETIITIDFLQDYFDVGNKGKKPPKLEKGFLKHVFSNDQNNAVSLEKRVVKSIPGSNNQKKKEKKALWNLTQSK
jgi:hypothetical protein